MQYQRLTDDASIIVSENGESQLISSSLNTNRGIIRIRKIVLILVSIQLILCVIPFVLDARLLIEDTDENYRQGMRSLAPIILSILYYTCGLIALYRYYGLGIYVFAWMGFLQYLFLCAEIFLSIVFIAKRSSHDKATKIGFYISLIICIVSTFQSILICITLKLTFKLMRLIKLFKRDVLEQI